MSEYRYILVDDLEYAASGEMQKAQFIDMQAPNAKFLEHLSPIRQEVMKALNWSTQRDEFKKTSNAETDEKVDTNSVDVDEVDAKVMMTTLDLAEGVDVFKVLLGVSTIVTSKKMAKVDGETNFTKPLYDNMSIKDIYGLTGTFLVNFILPSL